MDSEAAIPTDVKVTTEVLYRGALVLALMDAVYVSLLAWRVKPDTFRTLKWLLAVTATLFWAGLWIWAIANFWGMVYLYVLPPWARYFFPFIASIITGLVALCFWFLAIQSHTKSVLTFCLLGGLYGILTHIWAVTRGIVTKPPMLQGTSPLAAVVFACFEFIFYWCTILVITLGIREVWLRIRKHRC